MDKNNQTEQNYFVGLEKYGKVEQNEKKGEKYFIKITEGFKPKATRTMELLQSILDQIEGKNLVIEKFITDNNLYWLVLKPKQNEPDNIR